VIEPVAIADRASAAGELTRLREAGEAALKSLKWLTGFKRNVPYKGVATTGRRIDADAS